MTFLIRKYDRTKLILLAMLAASLPFYLQISNILIGIIAFLTVVHYFVLKRWDQFYFDKLSISFGCIFLLELIGLTYTEKSNIGIGLFTLDKHQAMLLIPIFFTDIILNHGKKQLLLISFVGGCLIASVVCVAVNMHESITVYDQVFHEWLFSHHRLAAPIGMHAVYLSLYLCFCVLIVLNGLKERYKTMSTGMIMFLLLLLFYMLVFIAALGARTVTVGLILIILVYLVYGARKQRSWRLYVLAALVPIMVAGFIWLNPVVKIRFMDMLKTKYESSNYGSFFARTDIWVPGLEAIKENLLFGVGTGDHQSVLNKKFLEHNYEQGVELNFNMHSQYLQTALNFGLLGVVVLFANFYIQIRDSLTKADPLYLSFLVLFMFASVTEATLVLNKGIIFFTFFSFVFFKTKPDLGSEKIFQQR